MKNENGNSSDEVRKAEFQSLVSEIPHNILCRLTNRLVHFEQVEPYLANPSDDLGEDS